MKINEEFRNLIPALSPEEYELLEISCLTEGIRDKLVCWLGTLLDGHNRFELAEKHHLPYETLSLDFNDENEAKTWIINNQFARRNLNAFTRAELALKLKPLLAAKAKEIGYAGRNNPSPKNSWEMDEQAEIDKIKSDEGYSYDVKINLISAIKQQYAKKLANHNKMETLQIYIATTSNKIKIGVSSNPQSRIDNLKTSDPDIKLVAAFDGDRDIEKRTLKKFADQSIGGEWLAFSKDLLAQVVAFVKRESERNAETNTQLAKKAEVSHDTIYKVEKILEKADVDTMAKVKSGELSVNSAYNKIKSQLHRDEIKEKINNIPLNLQKYRVVYADPPWSYGNDIGDNYGNVEAHYPTMKIEDICALPVKDMMETNAVLFLWATSPLLEDAFSVIHSWGFNYKTSFIWDKIKHNFGFYNSVRHELLLVATKGSCLPDVKELVDSVVSIERTKHSEKPEYFRELIEKLYPNGKKIELFARIQYNSWDCWGNQLGAK
jgi:N6-adenosine-specific RNA methylase IME4